MGLYAKAPLAGRRSPKSVRRLNLRNMVFRWRPQKALRSALSLVLTGGKGVELILDMVGGDYVERNYDAAAIDALGVAQTVQHHDAHVRVPVSVRPVFLSAGMCPTAEDGS